MSKLVLDIETIASKRLEEYKQAFEPAPPEPEPEPEPEINPNTGKPKRKAKAKAEPRARKLKSEKAGLSWLTGRIICVGLKPEKQPAYMIVNESEKEVIAELYDYLAARHPSTIISFNGRSFDVPFITMRGLLYNIDFSSLLPQDRFSKAHIDLYEVIGGKWGMSCKLSELAWFLGLGAVEGKGSDVQDMYDRGELDAIADHCQSDIETTEKIFQILYHEKRR